MILAVVLANIYFCTGLIEAFHTHGIEILLFMSIFILISLLINKYGRNLEFSFLRIIKLYLLCIFYTFSINLIYIYLYQGTLLHSAYKFSIVLFVLALELLWIIIYQTIRVAIILPEQQEIEHVNTIRSAMKLFTKGDSNDSNSIVSHIVNRNSETILLETNIQVLKLIENVCDLNSVRTRVVATTTRVNILNLPDSYFEHIINTKLINDTKHINKFLETINIKLKNQGTYLGCIETLELRKKRILKTYPIVINSLLYTIDSLFNRALPKLPYIKNIYFLITSGKNRPVSKAEILGRLYSCGFELRNYSILNGIMWFEVQRVKSPSLDYEPTYGPIIKLVRVGKNGELIRVYKMRTMYAFSEYIQEYVYNLHGSKNGDKIINDFRVTSWGKFFRKFWIDELPMIINLLKREIKIVGVRPLSRYKFGNYPKHLQELRIKVRPGLIPPFYADLPKTEDEFYRSEIDYLNSYMKHPVKTDILYFFKAMYNILVKRARSS